MVARFKLKCKSCGHNRFAAQAMVNDFSFSSEENEWASSLIFQCEQCSTQVANVTTRKNGEITLEENLKN